MADCAFCSGKIKTKLVVFNDTQKDIVVRKCSECSRRHISLDIAPVTLKATVRSLG